MKIKKIESINVIEFANQHSGGHQHDCVIRVVPGMATTNDGYLNFMTEVTSPALTKPSKLLFMDPYGDDMSVSVMSRIFGPGVRPIGVIDVESKVFYWGVLEKGKKQTFLVLTRMDVLRQENTNGDVLPDNFLGTLNQKRPYHFELNYYHVERFLSGDMGWLHLRDGLVAVVRCGNTRYTAKYEELI